MAWLDQNPPLRSQFRRPRREKPSGVVVVHTAENTPDFVAFDGGAEAVARFIRGRSDVGSYHDLTDSDSGIQLVDYDCEAFHDGTGSNPHSYGVSIATRADVWPLAPAVWRHGAVRQAAMSTARYARWLKKTHGIVIPARRISRAQSEARIPGFISHGERDPGRRHDPGAQFPWAMFLAAYAEEMGQKEDNTDMGLSADDRKWVEGVFSRSLSYLATGRGNAMINPNREGWGWADDASAVTLNELMNQLGSDERRQMLVAAGVYGAFDNAKEGRLADLEKDMASVKSNVADIKAMLEQLTS